MYKFLLSIILILTITGIIIFRLVLLNKKNKSQKKVTNNNFQSTYTLPTKSITSKDILISPYDNNQGISDIPTNCSPIPNNNLIKEISLDMDNDNKIELIKIYGVNKCQNPKPVYIKIYEKEDQCYLEKYTYPKKEKDSYNYQSHEFNILLKAEVINNFLNENRKALLVEGAANACGSGSEISMIFFTKENQKFNLIKGPVIFENDFYIIHPQFSGKYVLTGEAIWDQEETHFDFHRYRLFIYKYENNQYNKEELLITNKKYIKDDNADFQNFFNQLTNILASEINEKDILHNLRKKISELQL